MEGVQLIYSLFRWVSMNCISHRSVNGWMYTFKYLIRHQYQLLMYLFNYVLLSQ